MNKATAAELITAYSEVMSALHRIRRRQEKVGDKEFDNYPDAFDDFRYFGDKIQEALEGIEHRFEDAKDICFK